MGLTIDKLNVVLQKDEILHEVSLEVKSGEFVALLGASGCGKSTLLKSIAGLLEIKSGDIRIDEKSLLQIPAEKRGTIIVFQDLRLFPHMTVEKNICFPMELQKVPKEEQKAQVEEFLREVQLEGFEKRKIREMSGGQLQRVALARALAADPKVLLLDEPFSGLDERLRLEMGALVKKIQRERKITTILVTHDKREALQMSDRIALMSEGDILQYDTPQNIFYHPKNKSVADYFGKTNYILGKVVKGKFKCDIFEADTTMEDGMYEAMIRPFFARVQADGKGCIIKEIVFQGESAELILDTLVGKVVSVMDACVLAKDKLAVGQEVGIRILDERAVYYRCEKGV